MSETSEPILRVDGPTGVLPLDTQLEAWLRHSGEGGRRRHHAMNTLFELAKSMFSVNAVAILGGDWLFDGKVRAPVWQQPVNTEIYAEGIGELSPELLADAVGAVVDNPDLREPPTLPRVIELPDGLWIIDLSVAGQRTAFLLIRTDASEMLRVLSEDARASNSLVLVTGLMRGDAHRVREERLAQVLADVEPVHLSEGDRPYTAQEVVERVALVADGMIAKMATLFEIGVAGLYLPDADDDFVWCLGRYHLHRHAYDAGNGHTSAARFGLTASAAMSVAYDREGLGVVVRALADRRSLLDRYADLGVDEEDMTEGVESFFRPEAPEVSQGPWVFTAQRLPSELSPARRNLVVRMQGRTRSDLWARAEHNQRTARDRKRRIASVARRVHADVTTELTSGLRRWRDGMREEVMRVLGRSRSWNEACSTLAAGLSARCVSVFEVRDEELVFRGWSLPGKGPSETFDCATELLDAREAALLRATLRPQAREIGVEGFLRWPPLMEAMGRSSENVCTCPITRGERTIGLLRVDGAMHLFGAHIRRGQGQDALARLRPGRTPHHVWRSMKDLVGILGLALGTVAADRPGLHWPSFVEEACSGTLSRDEAIATLVALRATHGSRQDAAAHLGVHRNTFRRHLSRLESVLGMRW